MTRRLPILLVAAAMLAACSDSGDAPGTGSATVPGAAPEAEPGTAPAPDGARPEGPFDPVSGEPTDEPASGDPSDGPPDPPPEPDVPEPSPGGDPGETADDEPGDEPTVAVSPIAEPADLYTRDGYGTVDMLRVDIRTVTTDGRCTADDLSGCTLADVIADTDPDDELVVDIPVHFTATDFPDDGRTSNAEMRQRGASARLADRKSFRVELKGDDVRWRGEDKLQINKHPYDSSLIRNKLAFDLMSRIDDLPSIRTQFVNLWIDDGEGPVDYGVFTHDEAAGDEFLENRGWDDDSAFYKAEKFLFTLTDLEEMAIDGDGEPLDEERFESRLEIENGKDHRPVHAMVRAMSDGDLSFADVLAEHFDEDNVMAWVAVNLLFGQPDATTHNFFLYNPDGTERFYFLPWDYDYALATDEVPTNGFATEALSARLFYGFGKGEASEFLKRLHRQPDFHEKLLEKVDELRRGPLSDASIAELAASYTAVVTPFAARGPERYVHKPEEADAFAGFVATNEAGIRDGFLPLPPSLAEPRVRDGQAEFRWSPAHDVTGRRTLTYDLEVSTSPNFGRGDRVFIEYGIPDAAERVRFSVPTERIGSGRRYVRLVARADEDPTRLWQIALDRTSIGGKTRIGVRGFDVP